MLSRVALGTSLLVTEAAHAGPTHARLDTVTEAARTDVPTQHRVDGVLGTGGAGGRYRFVDESLALEVQGFVAPDGRGAFAKLGLARFGLFGVEHELAAGAGYEQSSAQQEAITAPTMSTHTPLAGRLRREHRFLSAYINDTVRFIRALDITTGLVVEQWRNLGGDSTITYGSGPPMEVDTRDVAKRLAPTLSMTGHLGDSLSVTAQTFRGVEELGPTLQRGRWAASLRAFDSDELGRGIATEASVQPIGPLIATAGYVHAANLRRVTTTLTYNDPRIATLSARYDSDARLDALAVRRVFGGFSGFVGVADLFGAERQVQVGVRGYFASGTP